MSRKAALTNSLQNGKALLRSLSMSSTNSVPTNSNFSEALDAWNAWQEKLAKSNLTSEQKEQATAVLIKLMTARSKNAQARGQ